MAWAATSTRTKVYPRVCGGISGSLHDVRIDGGLSPRVRGNLVAFTQPDMAVRSIPACAGESAIEAVWIVVVGVYPRVCGGIVIARPRRSQDQGLSPRVRGNLATPAPGTFVARVYPRVCGGIFGDSSSQLGQRGLSPRVRGNPECID